MRLTHGLVLLALAASGCAQSGPVDTATLPAGTYTDTDVDGAALYEANQAFGLGGHLPASPQQAAHAYAALDYVAGAVNTHSPYVQINGAAQAQILMARTEARKALGIDPAARSQAVVNALLAVSAAPDAAALRTTLSNTIFTLGPDATLQRLQSPLGLYTTPYAIAAVYRGQHELEHSGCNSFVC